MNELKKVIKRLVTIIFRVWYKGKNMEVFLIKKKDNQSVMSEMLEALRDLNKLIQGPTSVKDIYLKKEKAIC